MHSHGVMRIGCGAGYSGDRIDPAIELATHGDLDVLVFECLAERTIALAQQAKARDPEGGYDPLLLERMAAVLPACLARGTRIVTNMGAANPLAAAARVARLARERGWRGLTIAAITGDDVLDEITRGPCTTWSRPAARCATWGRDSSPPTPIWALPRSSRRSPTGRPSSSPDASPIPALFLAPLMAAFQWRDDDWRRLGCGTVVGHLLECAGQVTGGYLADPATLPVPDLARLGFPLAEVRPDGSAIVTKVPGSGGVVSPITCSAQLLYEVHDPARYVTPDVVADFSQVRLVDAGPDRVRVEGADGSPRPDRLKVSVAYRDGFVGEGQISYAGPGALGRARLARDVVVERLRITGVPCTEIRADLIGVDALHADTGARASGDPYEVRVRVAGRVASAIDAARIGREVEALYTNGPAGGGGATISIREVIAIGTTFVPRDRVSCAVHYEAIP